MRSISAPDDYVKQAKGDILYPRPSILSRNTGKE